jgi:plasmid stabilization system protein ParE
MNRVRVLPEAEKDIDQNYIWIAKRSREGAARWYRRLLDVLESLKSQPLSFGLAPEHELVGRDIRQVNFKTRRGRMYRVLFEVRADEVCVLHVRGPGQRLLGKDDLRSP